MPGKLGPGRTHGIRGTYHDGCRCGPCREAERLYRARLRGSKRSYGARRTKDPLPALDPYPKDPFHMEIDT